MTPRRTRSQPRGFALLIVMWTMGILALLGTRLTATARTEMRLAMEVRDRALAEAAADGAIHQAMFVLLGGGQIGSPGVPLRIRIGQAVVDITAVDEAAKINPNAVPRDVLRGLLVALGVDQPGAARLSGEIADWRNRSQVSVLGGQKISMYRDRGLPYRSGDHAFYSVNELGLVPDMTRDILVRLQPWLSVYQEGDVSDPGGASPAATAIGDARTAGGDGATGPGFVSRDVVMRVTAVAVVRGGARFVRSAVVRVRTGSDDATGTRTDVIQVLTWE
jgi:general secretion pathway protein K